jgi:hypothetical protein
MKRIKPGLDGRLRIHHPGIESQIRSGMIGKKYALARPQSRQEEQSF